MLSVRIAQTAMTGRLAVRSFFCPRWSKKSFPPPAIPSRFFACVIEQPLRRSSSQQETSATKNDSPFNI